MVGSDAASLFSLKGLTVILTGASGFLGRNMATILLENQARVIALGRSERTTIECDRWKAKYGNEFADSHRVDMYDLEALENVLRKIIESEGGAVDVLINNAHELGAATGFNVPEGALENAEYDQWHRNMMGGVFWPALTTKVIGEAMLARSKGSIINISSMYGVVSPSPHLYEGTSFQNPPGYSTAKAAMLGFTRYIAAFWGQRGVRANAILPGPFSNTEEKTSNSVCSDDPFLEKLKERTCLGRLGVPRELAGPLLFLASDASSFVTGHSLLVDGGWTTT
jgi:NAD(P)-dependent dehydrogenase (short-subunit alcohol dehydrogenase family)